MFGSPLFMSSLLDVPRPFIDAVSSSTEALGVAGLVFERPRRESTIVLVLDAMRRGIHLNRFASLETSTLHHIIADCSELPNPHGVVLFSSRTTSQSLHHDQSLLHLAHTILHNAGLELQQWIVTGPGEIYCPSAYCPGACCTTSSRT
jgi:hypothetical protein